MGIPFSSRHIKRGQENENAILFLIIIVLNTAV